MSSILLEAPSESGRMLVDPDEDYRYLHLDDLLLFPDELGGKPVVFELEAGRLSIKDDPDHEWTIEEMQELPTLFASGSVTYEIHRGRLLIMCVPSFDHGVVQALVSHALVDQGTLRGHGTTSCEFGIYLKAQNQSLRAPDAAFVSKGSKLIRRGKGGYLATPPDLCVEIRSPGNSKKAIDRKIELYFEMGVRVVWVIEPKSKSVVEHRGLKQFRVLKAEEFLEIPDVIPGFRLRVGELFPE